MYYSNYYYYYYHYSVWITIAPRSLLNFCIYTWYSLHTSSSQTFLLLFSPFYVNLKTCRQFLNRERKTICVNNVIRTRIIHYKRHTYCYCGFNRFQQAWRCTWRVCPTWWVYPTCEDYPAWGNCPTWGDCPNSGVCCRCFLQIEKKC